MSPPPGRSEKEHDAVIYANFADVFASRQQYQDKATQRRFLRAHLPKAR